MVKTYYIITAETQQYYFINPFGILLHHFIYKLPKGHFFTITRFSSLASECGGKIVISSLLSINKRLIRGYLIACEIIKISTAKFCKRLGI